MNCKPGDMAVIIRSLFEENVGNIVQVLRPAVHPHSSGLFAWEAKPTRPVRGIDIHGLPGWSNHISAIPDSWLSPIRPPEQPETTHKDEELTV